MIYNDFSIGSFLNATENEFISLYQQNKSLQIYPKDEIIEECLKKKEIAIQDATYLKQFKLTPEEIGLKLSMIVTGTFNNHRIEKRSDWSDYVEKNSKENFHVSISDVDDRGEECPFCNMDFKAIKYEIRNRTTMKSINFKNLTLHCIKEHDYFAKPGEYRLDPLSVCRVLQIVDGRV